MRVINITLSSSPKVGILETDDDLLELIRQKFSAPNKKRAFLKAWQRKNMPKRNYVITKYGAFRIGLLSEIYTFVKKLGIAFEFKVSPDVKHWYEPGFNLPEGYQKHDYGVNFPYRDVQIESLDRIFKRGRGIIEVGTGGGKGLVIASVCDTVSRYNPATTFLIVVPTHLVLKTVEEFVNAYKMEGVSGWSGTIKPDFTARVLIAGNDILCSQAERYSDELKRRSVCMIDEVHIIKEDSVISDILDKYVHTPHMIGFTGTLQEDNPTDRWFCIGLVGKVIYRVKSKKLKEQGVKADSVVYGIKLMHDKPFKSDKVLAEDATEDQKMDFFKGLYVDEREWIFNSKERNDKITQFIGKMCPKNTLIPVEQNEQQENLIQSLKVLGRPIKVIDGTVPETERIAIYKSMETEKDAILVVKVRCMAEGISVNNLHYLVFPFIQKSYIRLVQFLGRVERLADDKLKAVIYDFFDNTKYSEKQFDKRCGDYEKEGIPFHVKQIKVKHAD